MDRELAPYKCSQPLRSGAKAVAARSIHVTSLSPGRRATPRIDNEFALAYVDGVLLILKKETVLKEVRGLKQMFGRIRLADAHHAPVPTAAGSDASGSFPARSA
jgi:hypothetical protein